MKLFLATNSDFLINLFLQPNVRPSTFQIEKELILLDQII